MGLEFGRPQLESQLRRLVVAWPWARCNLLIYKMVSRKKKIHADNTFSMVAGLE